MSDLLYTHRRNPELNCSWHFAPFSGGREMGPSEPMQENFRNTPYASLVRESIQNSLDVQKDKSKPVVMEFSIRELDSKNYPNFFKLQKHIGACGSYHKGARGASQFDTMHDYIESASLPGEKLYYIRISDYNTTGMQYRPNAYSQRGEFYAFVRAAGVSDKADAGSGGSYGFGKAAYFFISPIRTLIVFTKTKTGDIFFEGVSALATHEIVEIDGTRKKYVDVGYYDNNNGNPITDYSQIPSRLTRKPNEDGEIPCGTDINIMGINLKERSKESIYDEMLITLLENFWLAILTEKLVVTIGDIIVNAETLPNLLESTFSRTDFKRVDDPRLYYEAVVNAGKDKNHLVFELDFEKYGIPLLNHDLEQTKRKLGEVKFYMLKTPVELDKVFYSRNPRMKVFTKEGGHLGYVGVFVCSKYKDSNEGIFNEILCEMENPAHNKWFVTKFNLPKDTLAYKYFQTTREIILKRFVTDSVDSVFRKEEASTITISGLEEFLYIPTMPEDIDDDDIMESLFGNPTGAIKDIGSSPTNAIGKASSSQSDKPSRKRGMVFKATTGPTEKDDNGDNVSGGGYKKPKTPGPKFPSAQIITKRVNPSDIGKPGKSLIPIPVDYRTFAQTRDGIVFHILIIHSDKEIEDARIDLVVCGEEKDIEPTVVVSNLGNCHNNVISDVHINKGKNLLGVKFSDNLKHSLKLQTYEIK